MFSARGCVPYIHPRSVTSTVCSTAGRGAAVRWGFLKLYFLLHLNLHLNLHLHLYLYLYLYCQKVVSLTAGVCSAAGRTAAVVVPGRAAATLAAAVVSFGHPPRLGLKVGGAEKNGPL